MNSTKQDQATLTKRQQDQGVNTKQGFITDQTHEEWKASYDKLTTDTERKDSLIGRFC